MKWPYFLKIKTPYFKLFYEKYMIVMGTLGQLLFYLQAAKIFHTRSAYDISLSGFTIAFFSLLSWLIYGIIIDNKVLVIVNISGCLGAGLVILLKVLVDHHLL